MLFCSKMPYGQLLGITFPSVLAMLYRLLNTSAWMGGNGWDSRRWKREQLECFHPCVGSQTALDCHCFRTSFSKSQWEFFGCK